MKGEYKVKGSLWERMVTPTLKNGSQTSSLSAREGSEIEVFDMMCLRSISGVRGRDGGDKL